MNKNEFLQTFDYDNTDKIHVNHRELINYMDNITRVQNQDVFTRFL